MTRLPLVSVIIRTFNRKNLVLRALRSVQVQTYTPLDIIIIDDGSQDGTRLLLENLPGIVYLYQPNQGVGKACNQGLKLAQGIYVAFLDDDDELLPENIATKTAYLEAHPETGAVFSNGYFISAEGETKNHFALEDPAPEEILLRMCKNNFIPFSNFLFRKEKLERIGPFCETLDRHEDYECIMRYASRFTLNYLPKFLTRCHEDASIRMTQNRERMWITNLMAKKMILTSFQDNPTVTARLQKSIRQSRRDLFDFYFKQKAFKKLFQCFRNELLSHD